MSRYRCNLSGQCEPDESGHYISKEECQEQCQGLYQDEIEVEYLVRQYGDFVSLLSLAPSDRRNILQRMTGVFFPSIKEVDKVIQALEDRDYLYLLSLPELRPYLFKNIHWIELRFPLPVYGLRNREGVIRLYKRNSIYFPDWIDGRECQDLSEKNLGDLSFYLELLEDSSCQEILSELDRRGWIIPFPYT